jgi:hypothetical protein
LTYNLVPQVTHAHMMALLRRDLPALDENTLHSAVAQVGRFREWQADTKHPRPTLVAAISTNQG